MAKAKTIQVQVNSYGIVLDPKGNREFYVGKNLFPCIRRAMRLTKTKSERTKPLMIKCKIKTGRE